METVAVYPSHAALRETPALTERQLPAGEAIVVTVRAGPIMLQSKSLGRRRVLQASCGEV